MILVSLLIAAQIAQPSLWPPSSEPEAQARNSAENPRYVETVARRGYRFIEQVGLPDAALNAPPPSQPVPAAHEKKRLLAWLLLAAAATAAIVTMGWYGLRPRNVAVEQPLAAVPLTSDPGKELCASLSPDANVVTAS